MNKSQAFRRESHFSGHGKPIRGGSEELLIERVEFSPLLWVRERQVQRP
jgi:hypothetical protein